MSYTSVQYYYMVGILVLVYYLFPKRWRWITLLCGSILFYTGLISNKRQLAVFLLSVITSYFFAIACEKLRDSDKQLLRKTVLWVGIIIIVLPLLLDKVGSLTQFSQIYEKRSSLVIPIGLSFYTLQLGGI